LFANRRRFCLAAAAIRANEGAGIAARPRAEILASCAAQHAAFSRHCRMRRLRSCSTIATFPVQVRPVSDLPGPREAGLRAIMNDFSGPCFRADLRPSIDAVVHNYKGMNELSKDVVSWLTVDEDSAGSGSTIFSLES
jgi:hypothetical protein